jgi:hypothetical protein
MIHGTAICDSCGRKEAIRGREERPEGWVLVLRRRSSTFPEIRWDVCLGCIARWNGWGNPYLAGENGARVADVVHDRRTA